MLKARIDTFIYYRRSPRPTRSRRPSDRPRGQGGIDPVFDDTFGYLVRVDSNGSIVFSTVKSTYPNYVGILPDNAVGLFFVNYWTVEEGAPGVERTLSHIERVDARGMVHCQFVDSAQVNSVWKEDFGDDEPTIGDVSMLIDHLFISGVVLPCLFEADVNQSGGSNVTPENISIGDVSSLIDYLFSSGSSAGLAGCL